jgi:hypothetical protein
MKSHFLGCSEEDAILLAKEVRRTWTFLFQPSRMHRQSCVRRAYRRLPLPPWLTTYFGQKSTVGDILDSKQAQYYPENLSHQHKNHFRYNYFKKGGFQYSMFPIFKSRIRELREYIDESRPKSFLGVLKDTRNPGVYMITVGAFMLAFIGLLLTLFTLIVGIIQAWASVKAIPGRSKMKL